jgi:hypothetical protein
MAKTSTSFQVGNSGRPIGAKGVKTKIMQSIGIDSWQSLSDYVLDTGVPKLLTELQQLSGKDYVAAHLAMMEYFKPKMQRVETKNELTFSGCDDIFIEPKRK